MFDIPHEILQSHPFLMSREFETQVANNSESNGSNLFSRIRGIIKQGLRHFLPPQVVLVFSMKPISHYLFQPLKTEVPLIGFVCLLDLFAHRSVILD